MNTLFLLALLSVPAFAQTSLDPARVGLSVKADGPDFEAALRYELRQNRNIIFASKSPTHDIYVTARPLIEDGKFYGCAAAVLVVTKGKYDVSIHTGRSMAKLARHVAAKLKEDYFSPPERAK